MKLIAVTIVVASVALLAAACGGGPTDASDTRTAPTIPQPKPSWTTIGGIRLHTLRGAVVRTRGRGVKHGSAYDYRVGGSAVAVFFEHGRVASLRTWDPIVALPDGVRIGADSIRFPTDWRSMGSGVWWKGYLQTCPEEGLESSGEWRKIVRQRDGSGVLVTVDLGVEYALRSGGKPTMVELTWLAPGSKATEC